MEGVKIPAKESRVKSNYRSRIEWVPVAIVRPHPDAQRPYDDKWAHKIAAELDPDGLGYPLVWTNGVDWFSIDGQHRFAAVKIALGADQRIECEVVRGITLERAAQLYRERNNIRLPTALAKFLPGITARDPECLAINGIVLEAKLTIAGNSSPGTVSCVQALIRIYRYDPPAHAGQLLARTLHLSINAWGRKAEAMNGDLLTGIGMFCRRYRDQVDDAVITKRLTGVSGGASGMLGRGRTLRDAMGGSLANSIARQLVILYNTNRRTGKITDWDAKPAGVVKL